MRNNHLFFLTLLVLSIPVLNGQGLDAELINEIRQSSINIKANNIAIYNTSPMIRNGKCMYSKQVWDWVMANSIFKDTASIKEKSIFVEAQVIDIDYGEGVAIYILYADNHLYEVVSLNDNYEKRDINKIEIGEIYSLVLFPYYNFPYTMAYHRNFPIFLDGHVIWIINRKLDSNIYVSPDIDGIYYNPSDNREKRIQKSVGFPESLLKNAEFKL